MSVPYIASNSEPVSTDMEWATVVEVPGTSLVNWFTLVNEGDDAGFWRLVDGDGKESGEARLPSGGGEAGTRRAAINIPAPGFAGKLQVRADGVGRRVTGVFAFGMK